MTIKEIKIKIQYRQGIPANELGLICHGRPLEDERTLAEYNIRGGSIIHANPKLRGGMYHLTSGRQYFQKLPFESAMAIRKILAFQFIDVNNLNHSTMTELQESILEAQDVLSTLLDQIRTYSSPGNLPNVKTILQPSKIDDKVNGSDDDSDD